MPSITPGPTTSNINIPPANSLSAQVKSEYQTSGNTFVKTQIPNPERLVNVEVGDLLQAGFFPQFKTKHWNNECNFSMRLVDDLTGNVTTNLNKIIYDKPSFAARFYTQAGDEDGQFEFDVLLKTKPLSNVVNFTIQSKNLIFAFQPGLDVEFAAGNFDSNIVSATPNDAFDINSVSLIHRAPNIVGSYAVYHATKVHDFVGGNQYRAGKAFHIYRPIAIDANNNQVFCDINIDPVGGMLTITVPQSFLDAAIYPVIVDPTMGYTTIGATSSSNFNNTGNLNDTYTASTGDTVTQYNFYGSTTSANPQMATYTISGGIFVTRQDATGPTVTLTGTNAWQSVSAGSVALTGGTLYGCAAGQLTSTITLWMDTLANSRDSGGTQAALPATWSHASTLTQRISFYATITSSAPASFSEAFQPISQPQDRRYMPDVNRYLDQAVKRFEGGVHIDGNWVYPPLNSPSHYPLY